MVKQSDYNIKEVKICSSVLLELMTILGEFRENVIIIGGNVPPLLMPNAEEKYPGTLDIDIALDSRKISDDTYRTILEKLIEGGYYQRNGDQPFRFYRDVNEFTIEIDLLSGEYGGTRNKRRHQKVQDIKARKARGCDLVFSRYTKVTLSGKLPTGAENKVVVKVAGIGPFLVTKGMALDNRLKEKDAFDIYYCIKNFPGGIDVLVEVVKPILMNKLGKEGFNKVKTKFETLNSIGPNFVVDFLEITDKEEREIEKRKAFELISNLLYKLDI